jgi:hypothetical protein
MVRCPTTVPCATQCVFCTVYSVHTDSVVCQCCIEMCVCACACRVVFRMPACGDDILRACHTTQNTNPTEYDIKFTINTGVDVLSFYDTMCILLCIRLYHNNILSCGKITAKHSTRSQYLTYHRRRWDDIIFARRYFFPWLFLLWFGYVLVCDFVYAFYDKERKRETHDKNSKYVSKQRQYFFLRKLKIETKEK